MRKLAIFQSDLAVGGVQKALLNLLPHLPKEEYEIDLFIFQKGRFFEGSLGENVTLYELPRAKKIVKYLPYALAERLYTPPIDLQKHYDAAIDFNSFWHECSVGALKVNADRRFMWLHSDIALKRKVEYRYKINWVLGRGKLTKFDGYVAVSPGVRESYFACTRGEAKKKPVKVMSNFVNTAEIFEKADRAVDFRVNDKECNIVSVGRLGYEKGMDILIGEFAKARKQRSDLHLYLIGEGDQRAALEAQAASLGLSGCVTFLGNQPNPFPYVKQMDAFALTSRYEGQGIVIWEAKALGLPLIVAKHLEAYNPGVVGVEDVAAALTQVEKQPAEKKRDPLCEYNAAQESVFESLFSPNFPN